jgi:hypothetical protein
MPTDQTFFWQGRILVWVSAGAASACAAKLAKDKYPGRDVRYLYCDVSADEHHDNQRFLRDIEKWLDIEVDTIGNKKYRTTDEVFEDKQFMSSPNGACCTAQLKKVPRFAYQWPEDIHVFGFGVDETMPGCGDPRKDRIATFERENPDLFTDWILRDAGMDKGGVSLDAGTGGHPRVCHVRARIPKRELQGLREVHESRLLEPYPSSLP